MNSVHLKEDQITELQGLVIQDILALSLNRLVALSNDRVLIYDRS